MMVVLDEGLSERNEPKQQLVLNEGRVLVLVLVLEISNASIGDDPPRGT